MEQKNPHDGHRARMKAEFLKNGFSPDTPPHKILEMLLFYCIPRSDTNPLAHELLARYGNIAGVLDAPVEELIRFPGITEKNVGLFKLILPVARIYLADRQGGYNRFFSLEEIGRFFCSRFLGLREECFALLCLDAKGNNLGFDIISSGDAVSVGVSTRKVVQLALKNEASCVVFAHNHPSDFALPSDADATLTARLIEALGSVDIQVMDHLIISAGDYVSMEQSTKFKAMFH